MSQTARLPVTRHLAGSVTETDDAVVVEEPLEIRVGERPVSVTMRTPGHDFELAAGFLFTESIVQRPEDIESIRHWGSANIVRVALKEGVQVDLQRLQRHFYSTSSCGVCGKTSIDAVRIETAPVESDIRVTREVIDRLPEQLRAAQATFDETGGIHAAGLFDSDGTLLRVREDLGRHNAVDKVIGSALLDGMPLEQRILFVSSRTSFELVQKAAVAKIPLLAAVGAPSSLAVELARDMNMTLLGFVRDGRFNVYAGNERIAP
ncbi:MAG TPA: formate dehydrogenase accessory sulfurtransferase FdhD [Thermoanaerobaculia bacterium]